MKRVLFETGSNCIAAVKQAQAIEDLTIKRTLYMLNKIAVPDDVLNPDGNYRRYLGSSKHNSTFSTERLWVDDETDTMYYVRDIHRLIFAHDKLFTVKKWDQGMTIKLKSGITKFWGKTDMKHLPLEVIKTVLTYTKNEWVLDSGVKALNAIDPRFVLNNAMFKRVLRKKITNPEDLVRNWLKENPYVKYAGISHRAKSVIKILNNKKLNHGAWDMALRLIKISTNKDYILDMVLQNQFNATKFPILGFGHQQDLERQLVVTGEKIDATWSVNRLDALHTRLSTIIRNVELIGMVNQTYGYNMEGLPLLRGMKLITTTHDIFMEGKVMEHCIGSYKHEALTRRQFHFHCELRGGSGHPFSLAIYRGVKYVDEGCIPGDWEINQMYRKYNGACANYERRAISRWLQHPEVQDWFTNEFDRYEFVRDHIAELVRTRGIDRAKQLELWNKAGINVAEDADKNGYSTMSLLSSADNVAAPAPPPAWDDIDILPF